MREVDILALCYMRGYVGGGRIKDVGVVRGN